MGRLRDGRGNSMNGIDNGAGVDDVIIRNERPDEWREVEELTREAFWNVNMPGCSEHYLVHVLRSHPDFVPELDLVAQVGSRVVANVMYTRARLVDRNGGDKRILTFGPLSVLPEFQRRGFGKALLDRSFSQARAMGYDAIVIFGDPDNYVSRGFASCRKFDVDLEDGIYPSAMMVKELVPGSLAGRSWRYVESDTYRIDEAAAERFDFGFEPKKKGCRPSQESFYICSRSRVL